MLNWKRVLPAVRRRMTTVKQRLMESESLALKQEIVALQEQLRAVRSHQEWDADFATKRAERVELCLGQIVELRDRVEHLHTKTDRLYQQTDHKVDRLRETIGRIEARQTVDATFETSEFRAFSQWGEDGILQYLVRAVPLHRRIFVEFGVEDYTEANTRFLLTNNNWTGLVLDGGMENIRRIQQSALYWLYNLKAAHAFITRENIDTVLAENGITGEIGVLSIDIDGNDYWVWEAITVVQPAIVVCEYNYRFGPELSVTVPYDPTFVRTEAHYSTIYFGASLASLCKLGAKKGYDFVGCGSNGVNAFFVRSDIRPDTVPKRTPTEGFRYGTFSEFHTPDGEIVKISDEEQQAILLSLPLVTI